MSPGAQAFWYGAAIVLAAGGGVVGLVKKAWAVALVGFAIAALCITPAWINLQAID